MAKPPINEQDFLKALGKISGKQQTKTTTGGLGKSPLQNYFETKNAEAAKAAEAVGTAGKILKPIFKGIGIIDAPRRLVISGVREIVDVLDSDPDTNASFSDFLKQSRDITYGFGTAFPVKNKWGGRILGFIGDVALDPWTYATLGGAVPAKATMTAIMKGGKVISKGGKTRELLGGVKYVHGREGRLALANLARSRMEAMAEAGIKTFSKDDIGKVFRDVSSEGKKKLPGYLRDDLGIRGPGIYYFGSRVKLPGSGAIGGKFEDLLTGARLGLVRNAGGRSVMNYVTPDGTFQAAYIDNQSVLRDRVNLASGTLENGDLMTPQQALDAGVRLRMHQAQRTMTAKNKEYVTQQVVRVVNDPDMEANRLSLTSVLETEGGIESADDIVRPLAQKVRNFLDGRFEDVRRNASEVSEAHGSKFKRRPNYVPHMESDDALVDRLKMGEEAWKTRTGGAAIDDSHRFASPYRRRSLEEGDNFFGHTIEARPYTIDELNDMAKNPGSLLNPETKQPFEALTYNFYENDMVKILQKYSDHFAQQQGHNAYLLTAKREGGDFFRIIKKDIDDDPLVAIDTSDAVGELTSRAMTTAGRVGIEATETIDGSVDQFAIDPIGTLQRIVRQKNVFDKDVAAAEKAGTRAGNLGTYYPATNPTRVPPTTTPTPAVAPTTALPLDPNFVNAIDEFGSTLNDLKNVFEVPPKMLSDILDGYEKIKDKLVNNLTKEGIVAETVSGVQALARDLQRMVEMGNYVPKRSTVVNSAEAGTRLGFDNVIDKKTINSIQALIKNLSISDADTIDKTIAFALKDIFNKVDKQLFASSEAKFGVLQRLYENAKKLKSIRAATLRKRNLSRAEIVKNDLRYGFALQDMQIFGNIIRGIDERVKQYVQFNFGPSVLGQQEIRDITADVISLYVSQTQRELDRVARLQNLIQRTVVDEGGLEEEIAIIKGLIPDLDLPLNTEDDLAQFIRVYLGDAVNDGLLEVQRKLLKQRVLDLETDSLSGIVAQTVLGREPKTALEISNEVIKIKKTVNVKATKVTAESRRAAQLKKYPQNEQKLFNEHLRRLETKKNDIIKRLQKIIARQTEVKKIQTAEENIRTNIFVRIQKYINETKLENWFRPQPDRIAGQPSTRFKDFFLESMPKVLGKNKRYSNLDDMTQKFVNENSLVFDLLDTLLTKNPNGIIDAADFEIVLDFAFSNSARAKRFMAQTRRITGRTDITNYDDLKNFLFSEAGASQRTNKQVADGLLAPLMNDFTNDVAQISELTANELRRDVAIANRALLLAEQEIEKLTNQIDELLPDEYFARFQNSILPEQSRQALDAPTEIPLANRVNPETGEITGQQNLAANKQMLLEENDFYPQAKAVLNRMQNLQQLANIDGNMVDWTFGGRIQFLYNNQPISFTPEEWNAFVNPRNSAYVPNDKIQYIVSRLKDEDLRRVVLGDDYTDQTIPDDEMLQRFVSYISKEQPNGFASEPTFLARQEKIGEAWNKSDANKFLFEHTRVKNQAAEEAAKRQPKTVVSELDREVKGLDNQIDYLTTERVRTQEWWETYGASERPLNTVEALRARTQRITRLTNLEYSDVFQGSQKAVPEGLKARPRLGGPDYDSLVILGVPESVLNSPNVKVLNDWLREHPEIFNSILANFNDIQISDLDEFIFMTPTTRAMRDKQVEVLQAIKRNRLETNRTKGRSIGDLIREKQRLFRTPEEDKVLADTIAKRAQQRARIEEIKKKQAVAKTVDQPTQKGLVVSAFDYSGGHNNVGKGTPTGDGKDVAMRKVADSSIVELANNKPSSSLTTATALGQVNNDSKVIMLARNSELRNQPLKEATAVQIRNAHARGARFVVGDMPGVDSQFIDLLDEIGASYTIYHTGNTSRIVRPRTSATQVQAVVPEYNPNLPYHQQLANVERRTLQSAADLPPEKTETINRLVQQFDSQYDEFDRAAQAEALRQAQRTKGVIASDSTVVDFDAMARMRDTENILASVQRRGTATPVDEVLLDAGTKEAEAMLVASRLPLAEVEARLMDGVASMARPATGTVPFRAGETGIPGMITDGWKRLGGKFDDIEVTPEFYELWKNASYFQDPAFVRQLTNLIGGYTKFHKAYATLTPGFHVRNFIGNVFQYVLAGGQIAHYRRATEIFFEWNEAYGKGVPWKKFLETLSPEEQVFATKARTATLGSGGGIYSDLFQSLVPGSKSYDWWLTRASKNLGQKSDNMSRFVLGYDSAVQGMSVDMTITRIKRFYFDYEDLSKMDRAMKQFVPFWIWTSRNLPLQLQNMWLNPKPYQTYNSVVRNLRDKETEQQQPLPVWLQQVNAFRVPGLPLYAAPDLGFNRVQQQLEQLAMPKKFGSNLNPLLRVPIEQTLGQNLFNDQKLESPSDRIINIVQGSFVPVATTDRLLNSYGDAKINGWLGFFGSPIKKIKKE
jgi:hypothetical protein